MTPNAMLINGDGISLSPEHQNVIRSTHRTARRIGIPPLCARFLSVTLAHALFAAEADTAVRDGRLVRSPDGLTLSVAADR